MSNAVPYPFENEVVAESGATPSDVGFRSARLGFFFVVLFTVAVFARPEDVFPILGECHLTFVLGLCAGLSYAASLFTGNAPLLWSKEIRIVLLLTGWFVAGVPFAYWRSASFNVLTQVWLKTLIVFFLLTQTLTTLGRVRKVLWAIILSELVICAYSTLHTSQAMWVGDRLWGVNLGLFEWNYLGVAAALTIPYIAAIYVSRPGLFKTGLLAASVLFLMWMLVLTASRSAFLDVVVSIGLTSLLVLRGNPRGKRVGIALALVLIVAIAMAPGVFWQRLETLQTNSDSADPEKASAQESKEGRLKLLTWSLQYTLSHPIFGLGLGNFEIANGTDVGRSDAWMETHNTFTEISSEAGVPALLLYVGLFITVIRNIKRVGETSAESSDLPQINLMARATLASLLSCGFGAFFANLAYDYYFFYLVAIAVGIQRIAQEDRAALSPNPISAW